LVSPIKLTYDVIDFVFTPLSPGFAVCFDIAGDFLLPDTLTFFC